MKPLFFSLLVTSSLCAIPSGCPEIRLPSQPCDPCGKTVIPPPCICGYNTPARIDVRGCFGVHVTGSYLYWMPNLEGIDLGVNSETFIGGMEDTILNGKIVDFDYDYRSGFKAGVAVLYDYDHWECEAEYTYYHEKQNTSGEGFICPKWINVELIEFFDFARQASGEWKLDMDWIDFHFARQYYVGKKFTLRPFFGGEVQWIKQKFDADYTDEAIRTLVSENKISLNAYGTRAGLESNWIFGETFRIVGALAGSILYTEYDVSTKQFFRFDNPLGGSVDGPTRSSVSQNNVWYLRPHMEMRFGFALGDYFCCDRFYVDIGAFYEFHVFWNQNMFMLLYDFDCPKLLQVGDLYLQGLTATLKVAF